MTDDAKNFYVGGMVDHIQQTTPVFASVFQQTRDFLIVLARSLGISVTIHAICEGHTTENGDTVFCSDSIGTVRNAEAFLRIIKMVIEDGREALNKNDGFHNGDVMDVLDALSDTLTKARPDLVAEAKQEETKQ